jgi:DNA modification methylase
VLRNATQKGDKYRQETRKRRGFLGLQLLRASDGAGGVVLDPLAGSRVTGEAADLRANNVVDEVLSRRLARSALS